MIRTLHAQLADAARASVRADERIALELLSEGIVPAPEQTFVSTRLRDSLKAYDAAAEVASNTPLRSLIEKAHAELEAGNTAGVSQALASALLVLDYDPANGPFAPEVAQVN